MFIVLGAVGTAAGVALFCLWLIRGRSKPALPLAGTVLLSFGALAMVTGWVLAEGGVNRGEALKTGGLAAGSVVALYALWLNDRRRRVDEQRQEIERKRQDLDNQRYELEQRRQDLENRRSDHDRERVADERFARAIELLGNDADQVRVGAVHALAGLARSRNSYTQTVLDVLCSYLRRPFDHPEYAEIRGEKPEKLDERASDRERQVRRTVQVSIADLLPSASEQDAPIYDLDLHGATVEYFDIAEKVIGQLRARAMNLYQANALWGMRIHGPAWLTGSHSWGRLRAHDTVFHDRAWFSRFEAKGLVTLERSQFQGDVSFANAIFRGPVSFQDSIFAGSVDMSHSRFDNALDLRVDGGAIARTHGMRVSIEHDHRLPAGWELDNTRGSSFGLVRA